MALGAMSDWNTDLPEPTGKQRRNQHNTWIGCVALPIIGYGIVRLLVYLLG